jgi:signal peptidase II
MTPLRRGILICLLLVATTGCDRVTKHFAATALAGKPAQSFFADTVRLAYHENPGGFLSTGATWRPSVRTGVFQLANGAFLFATLLVAARLKWSWFATIGLLLFLGGGFSNLIDRVAMGSVIDFMNLGIGPFRTGIFNVADVAIMAGVAILIVEPWHRRRSCPTVTR